MKTEFLVKFANNSTTQTINTNLFGEYFKEHPFVLATIILSIIIFIPVMLNILLSIIKPNLKKLHFIYLYSFISGFLVILSTFAFLREAHVGLIDFIAEKNKISLQNGGDIIYGPGALFGIGTGIIGGAVILTLTIAISSKIIITKKLEKKYMVKMKMFNQKLLVSGKNGSQQVVSGYSHGFDQNHGHRHFHTGQHDHSHSDEHSHIYGHGAEFFNEDGTAKTKLFAIILIGIHKIPDGLSIGFLAFQYADNPTIFNLAFLITFLMHIIPEEFAFFYRLIEYGLNRKKAVMFTILLTLTYVPTVYIGAALRGTENNFFIFFLNAAIGSLLLFTALFEFIPEIVREKTTVNQRFIIMILTAIGISTAILILVTHIPSANIDDFIPATKSLIPKILIL